MNVDLTADQRALVKRAIESGRFSHEAEAVHDLVSGLFVVEDRGAWAAWGANLAFTWFTGPLVRGGLVDIRSTGGASDITSAPAALALSCVFAALGLWSVLARPRR